MRAASLKTVSNWLIPHRNRGGTFLQLFKMSDGIPLVDIPIVPDPPKSTTLDVKEFEVHIRFPSILLAKWAEGGQSYFKLINWISAQRDLVSSLVYSKRLLSLP